jgi:hypothetical protein
VATRPDLRIGDADREAGAASLREHYAQGRLSLAEFNERLDAIFAATTQGQLDQLTSDLPHVSRPAVPLPVATSAYAHGNSWHGNSWNSATGQGSSRARGPRHALGVVSGLVLILALSLLVLAPTLLHLRFFPLPGRFGVLLAGLLLIRSVLRRLFRRGR